jgi:hypothetical protein
MSDAQPAGRFIIQIDRPEEALDMPRIRGILADTGVELDEAYGPFLINPKLGRYVVRGLATLDARSRAEEIPGVRFFADAPQKPM